jgi:LacI family transcriptional regulator
MPVKLKDIAEKSGYSITTVSRALAGYDDVNEQTRNQIIELAISMGYQPNQVARQLRSSRTHTIGMIIPAGDQGFSDDFFSELMMGVGHAASEHGYDLLLSAQISADDHMDAYRRIVGGNRVDGVVLARTLQDDPRIEYLKQQNHPFVVAGRSAPGIPSDFAFIDADSQAGISMVVRHFAELGHEQIALLLPPEELAYTPYRWQGYQQGLEQAQIPYRADYVMYGDLKRSGGYEAAQRILDDFPQITAIIACNDPMAMGAMRAIQERGLTVGADVSVSGFDDIPAAEFTHPPLTTVRQPIYEIGERLVELQILLDPSLRVRDSSGKR